MKYSKELVQHIISLMEEDTYSISEICKIVGVARTTFYMWRDKKPAFAQALKDATEYRDEVLIVEARKSLRKKLQGFTAVETKTTYIVGKDEDEQSPMKVKERVVNEKYHAPDTSAIVFTLTNRDPQGWRNKQSTELTGVDSQPIRIEVIDEKTKKELEKLQGK